MPPTPPQPPLPDDWLTVREASDLAGYQCTDTIHNLVRDKRIIFRRDSPKKTLVSRASLLIWMEHRKLQRQAILDRQSDPREDYYEAIELFHAWCEKNDRSFMLEMRRLIIDAMMKEPTC